MKLLKYDIEFQFVKGSDLVIADALSRAYAESKENETADWLDIRNVKNSAFDQFPDARILEIRRATEKRFVNARASELDNHCMAGEK
ncbi:hypothetical protein DPMN_099754 [Dreissena polymorpha]|uniref:Uncharacterized protein n=1 Tax=Dreissena polymorpha TaxID=45954 RepID=A0A9D4LG37_DREPO|nr:hypothetical protein DPMN_099754 [Dreissena polymorpha]